MMFDSKTPLADALQNKGASIETDRLVLRPLCEKDALDVVELVRDCSSTARRTGRVPFPCRHGEEPETWFQRCREEMQLCQGMTFAAFLKNEDGLLVGLTSIGKDNELGFWFGRSYWGKGLIAEALSGTIRFGFNRLNLALVRINILDDNAPSRHIFQSLGFQERGVLQVERMGNVRQQVMYELQNNNQDHQDPLETDDPQTFENPGSKLRV